LAPGSADGLLAEFAAVLVRFDGYPAPETSNAEKPAA
jgi:hypothetical protein